MPKLKNQLPRYCKLKIKKRYYAVVYYRRKTIYLGTYGSPESKTAYSKLIAEITDAKIPVPEPELYVPDKEYVAVQELALSYLDHIQGSITSQSYGHNRSAVRALLELYGTTPVNKFTPSCLKLFRQGLINSKRLCRKMVNNHTGRIISMFTWGVEEELVHPTTEAMLKAIKPLREGYPGTFDHPEREDVPDEVIKRTIPFMVPTVAAMVKVQRLTGMRPSEVFKMRVGQIDIISDSDLWLYRLPTHKTKKKTKRDKVVPLSRIEQKLIAPYLEGKQPNDIVFSYRASKAECENLRRKPSTYKECFTKDSYRNAVILAIEKGNTDLLDDKKIPHWTPYQLRHSASSALEVEEDGIDKAQALLGHTSPNTTAKYNHRQLQKAMELARNRCDVFEER